MKAVAATAKNESKIVLVTEKCQKNKVRSVMTKLKMDSIIDVAKCSHYKTKII